MNEATKTRALWGKLELDTLSGKGIDIGCGKDLVRPDAQPFEKENGDANVISRHVTDQFDYVFSAHCLEHMHDPRAALREWWKLVRPGGFLFFVVPDEDLYEQGIWPSIFNLDHKATFTISKHKSWSPVSVNIIDLVSSLPGAKLVDIKLQDNGYDRRYLAHHRGFRWWARLWAFLRYAIIITLLKKGVRVRLHWISRLFFVPIDQTLGCASAQIQTIVQKTA